MKISEIRAFPITFKVVLPSDTSKALGPGPVENDYVVYKPGKYHESVLRSYQIVRKLRELLELNISAPTLLEMLDLMEEEK